MAGVQEDSHEVVISGGGRSHESRSEERLLEGGWIIGHGRDNNVLAPVRMRQLFTMG